MQFIATIRLVLSSLFENIAVKLLFILLGVLWFFATIGHIHAGSKAEKLPGVCVFDIDFTLQCRGASAAVKACKDAGFGLAVNTSRSKDLAYEFINDGSLKAKGFDQEFINLALKFTNNEGPFQYKRSEDITTVEEAKQNKSYGMRNIAKYYGFKLDDIDSRKLVLFDDMQHNIAEVKPSRSDKYPQSKCYTLPSGECYFDPKSSPSLVSFPRNWKIYSGLWIGNFCQYWYSTRYAADDARVMIDEVLSNRIHDDINRPEIWDPEEGDVTQGVVADLN